ncbi:proton-translocating NADH-quinone oxidoreductase, chain N [Rubrobacter radiotolerans]|uniref:NADH-quinone oxidoreductase subunit N n=1 Tax=Rubrobacter radiotolerans TaxID=42256 RepID=A0A023X3C5_RUBRA|nr:NADH-quinone oxidoreductase subunit N [Rubrobacter radiotolerans]AHY46848.1 proton-translocating NADH-quinone oxidoreductase, chain N [Rubrobacter radiotolerans]MDX5894254.1 NADH-quinone oxidoreductase subunit N [Rubrobacter radiotolerans]SMC05569.1 NADH dehydrogenase subunit N [Rubrobacter radiotolerans DSM 5868]
MDGLVTAQSFVALLPELIVGVFLILTLLVGVFAESPGAKQLASGLAPFGVVSAFVATVFLLASGFSGTFFGDGFVVDSFALYVKLVVLGAAFFSMLAAGRFANRSGDGPEYVTLMLSVVFGALLLVSMRDLFGLFLAIELATIPSYALVAFDRRRPQSAEGGMKYLVTGVVASSVLLYGIVLVYGFAGSAAFPEIAAAYSEGLSPVALLGLALFVSGLAFKLSAAPFHFWTPDAYQGAPTSAAAFLSVAPKAAFFAVLLRVLVEAMPDATVVWTALIGVLAIITMFTGNLLALRQTSVRRMLAYSSVAHSGYVLAAIAAVQGAGANLGVQAVLIYVTAYAVMNLGAFFVVDLVGEDFKAYNGLFRTHPVLALSMGAFMAALVGIPPFSGFFGKMWVILAGVQSGSTLVYVVVGAVVVNSVISLPYYFAVFRNMFLEEPAGTGPGRADGLLLFSVYTLAALTTLFVVFVGLLATLTGGAGLL